MAGENEVPEIVVEEENIYDKLLRVSAFLKLFCWLTVVYAVTVVGYNWMLFLKNTPVEKQGAFLKMAVLSSAYTLGAAAAASLVFYSISEIIKFLIRLDEGLAEIGSALENRK